jgi:hypothetical protein
MDLIRKLILILKTLIIDIVFIYIILKTKHTTVDRYYIFSVLLITIFFIFGLLFNNNTIIDGCHILYALSIIIAPLLCLSKNILTIILTLILTQQILKMIFGECIMYTSKDHIFKDLLGSFINRNIDNFVYILIMIILYKLSMK